MDLWKIKDLFLSFLSILLFYVHANTSSPNTYKRNNIKSGSLENRRSVHEEQYKKDIESSSGSLEIEDHFLSFLNILLFYVHAKTSLPSTYKRNNMKKISKLPVDLWKIADLFLSLNFKHTPVLRTCKMSSPSTDKRNNMKKISKLPVDLWKIADLFLSMNFTYSFSTYTTTSLHHVNSHPEPKKHPNNKQQNVKTITTQQQTTKRKNHQIRSHPMAKTAKSPPGPNGSERPPPPQKKNKRNAMQATTVIRLEKVLSGESQKAATMKRKTQAQMEHLRRQLRLESTAITMQAQMVRLRRQVRSEATRITTKTQARMKHLRKANLSRLPTAATRQVQKTTAQQRQTITTQIAIKRPTDRKLQVLIHIRLLTKRQFETLQ